MYARLITLQLGIIGTAATLLLGSTLLLRGAGASPLLLFLFQVRARLRVRVRVGVRVRVRVRVRDRDRDRVRVRVRVRVGLDLFPVELAVLDRLPREQRRDEVARVGGELGRVRRLLRRLGRFGVTA